MAELRVLDWSRKRALADKEITIGLPSSLLEALDEWAARAGVSRAEAIRWLLEMGLERFKDYAPIKDPE